PLLAPAVLVDRELRGNPEVALAPRREADVGTNPRDPERAHRVAVEVATDRVPGAVVVHERVGVDRALLLPVRVGRPVGELDRATLGDRAFELAEPAGHLARVVRVAHLDRLGGVRRRLLEARTAEREVL